MQSNEHAVPAELASLLQLDHQLCFALYSASLAMTRLYKPHLDRLGLTYPQYLVMLALWETDGQTVGELGKRLLLDSGTLTPLLKRMSLAGWLTRARSDADERRVVVTLTAAGQRLRQDALTVPLAVASASGCTLDELRRLTRELQGLRGRIDAIAGARAVLSSTHDELRLTSLPRFPTLPDRAVSSRSRKDPTMSLQQVLYTAHATSTGGRTGSSASDDGRLTVNLSTPKGLGGDDGPGTNPEQLFAAGYSACFLGALKFVAGQRKIALPADTTIKADIGIGPIPTGFGIQAALTVTIPGLDKAVATELVNAAHIVCPYSNATRGNIDMALNIG